MPLTLTRWQLCPTLLQVSTNIAETSLTVDGIIYVIDTGWVAVSGRYCSLLAVQPVRMLPPHCAAQKHASPPTWHCAVHHACQPACCASSALGLTHTSSCAALSLPCLLRHCRGCRYVSMKVCGDVLCLL